MAMARAACHLHLGPRQADGRSATGALWCDNDGTGRMLHTIARSGVSGAAFFDPEPQFYADQIVTIEHV